MAEMSFENIFPGGFASNLRRVFVPCSRIVSEEKTDRSAILLQNRVLHQFTASDHPVCTVDEGGFVILDFGRELSGGIRLVTDRCQPFSLRIRFGESVSECCGSPDPDHALHDMILTLPGLGAVDFGATGFRFVRLDAVSNAAKLVNVIALADIAPYSQRGVFHSSDERLNRIFDTAVHTVRLNIQDHIFDGIKRDRLLWGGDLHPEVSAILGVFGEIPEIDTTLSELCFHTSEGKFVNNLSSYPLWLLWVIRDLWFYSGRKSVLEKFRKFITDESSKLVSYISSGGTLAMPEPRFLDWPSSSDPAAVDAGLHALGIISLKAAAEMLSELQCSITHITDALGRLLRQVPDPGTSKTAAALLTLAGAGNYTGVLENEPFCNISTFLGSYVIFAKENSRSLELIKKYWGAMLDMGATSFWEDFDLEWCGNAFAIDQMPIPGKQDIHADFGNYCYKGLRHSLCHGWAAGPAAWCLRRVLGVAPAAPGFAKVRFSPDLCGMEFACGAIPTPHGDIKVSLKKNCEPEITLPDGVEIVL